MYPARLKKEKKKRAGLYAGEGARIVGERFRSAIKEASLNWLFPSTVTVGIATYPKHGTDVNTLIDRVEKASKNGKEAGKDRIVITE